MPSRFTRDQLSAMPMYALRALDIREKDEEDLVQDVLNAKLAHTPNPAVHNLPFVDIFTKEQEEARQREIDALNEASRKALLGEDASPVIPEEPPKEPELPPEELTEPSEIPEAVPVAKKKGRPKKDKIE